MIGSCRPPKGSNRNSYLKVQPAVPRFFHSKGNADRSNRSTPGPLGGYALIAFRSALYAPSLTSPLSGTTVWRVYAYLKAAQFLFRLRRVDGNGPRPKRRSRWQRAYHGPALLAHAARMPQRGAPPNLMFCPLTLHPETTVEGSYPASR